MALCPHTGNRAQCGAGSVPISLGGHNRCIFKITTGQVGNGVTACAERHAEWFHASTEEEYQELAQGLSASNIGEI